jgi:hypothetical protein
MNRVPELPDAPGSDPSIVNLHVRLFAVLDLGVTVIDPHPQTMGVGINRESLGSTAELQELLQVSLRHGDLPADHREAHWQRIVDGLADFDIHTDPETLQALPFELLLTTDVQDLLGT